MNKILLKIWLILCAGLLLQPVLVYAQSGHGHAHARGPSLTTSVAFDNSGVLWRAAIDGGYVTVARSADMGRTFSAASKLNAEPQDINANGDGRPKLVIGPEGNMYVTWTQGLSKPHTGYIWFARSTDRGASFSTPIIVHRDRAEITHRFDALTVADSGRIYVAWVDKRDLAAAKAEQRAYDGAAIYYAYSDDAGASFSAEQKLSDQSCECCRIAMATDASGNAVAMWRQLFDGGVRDHAIASFASAPVSGVQRASFGGWKIDACPHHGPALARGGDWGWHMAWFDGGEKTGLFYARMDGEAWVSSPARRFGDAEQQAGHPALLSLGERVWLVWKEMTDTSSLIRMATSDDGGRNWTAAVTVAEVGSSTDYPQLLDSAGKAYLSWNTAQDGLILKELKP